jgi:endonuclease III
MAEASKRLLQLIRRYEADGADAARLRSPSDLFAEDDGVVRELVFSLLAWNTRRAWAEAALAELAQEFVDLNDLRVCLASETARALGRDARSREKAERIRAALNDLYRREHRVGLDWLTAAGKREARAYLESLDGVPKAVASRVFLLCCGGHAVPVDDRLCGLLARHKCLDKETDADTAGSLLERQAKAGETLGWFAALGAWADAQPDEPESDESPASKLPAARAAGAKAAGTKPVSRRKTSPKADEGASKDGPAKAATKARARKDGAVKPARAAKERS